MTDEEEATVFGHQLQRHWNWYSIFQTFFLGLINLSDSCAKCGWSWSASYHQCFTIRDHRTCSNVCISLFLCSDKTDVDFPGWAELGQWIFVLKDIYQRFLSTSTHGNRNNLQRKYFTVLFAVRLSVSDESQVSAILQSFCILGCQPHKVSSRVSIIVCCCGQFWLSYDNMNSLNTEYKHGLALEHNFFSKQLLQNCSTPLSWKLYFRGVSVGRMLIISSLARPCVKQCWIVGGRANDTFTWSLLWTSSSGEWVTPALGEV